LRERAFGAVFSCLLTGGSGRTWSDQLVDSGGEPFGQGSRKGGLGRHLLKPDPRLHLLLRALQIDREPLGKLSPNGSGYY
jgi:hypothetical protein